MLPIALLFAAFALPASGQNTIFSSTSKPTMVDSNDSGAVELGVKFVATTNGTITGLRFYKARTNTGTHVAHLWSTTGTLLGSATFSNETRSGWQQVNFATPVKISANTTYVASYFAPMGHYSDNKSGFQQAVSSPPLTALQDGVSGPNGVYMYGSQGGFPTNGWYASNYWVDVVFTPATTTATATLGLSASSLSFGNITVGNSGTQTLALSSTGTGPVTVNSVSMSGAGFSAVAGNLPTTLNPGQSLTVSVAFTPTAAGSASGTLTVASNSSSGSNAAVALSGTGVTSNPQLALGATSLSFGNVAVNSSATQAVSVSSTGTSTLTINSAAVSGTGFSVAGGSFPMTLNPGQSGTLQVKFAPTTAGSQNGTLAISSNSSGGAASVALNGSGTSTTHEVNLSWSAPSNSADPAAGYNIYRIVGSGTAQLMNSSIISQTAFADTSVVSGTTYQYYVTSVDGSGVQSTPSNQISVTIP